MGVLDCCRRAGGILVHMYEIFRGIYRSEVYAPDDRRNDLQFPVSLPGDEAAPSGDFLCDLDRDRSAGRGDRGNRAV